ncbi:GapS1 family protein [Pantoea sp. FN0305]|uniref:GapS1 family protein n=1 Tax=Pantoea sp. FN0305 TaxID=3418559 RepID=UPI003CF10CDC
MKTLTPISYSIKAKAIKKKLARFKDHDFLENFYRHFHSFRNEKYGIVYNFPWCCFLALKWKFSSPESRNARSMSYSEFVKIINRIYDLQSEASNLNAEDNLILGVRRITINQLLYQHSDKFNYTSLIRQYIWYCDGDPYFKESFYKITGLEMNNYYRMASYLFIMALIKKRNDSEVFPYKLFILHWVPLVGIGQVKKFFNLISLKAEDIRGFIDGYKYHHDLIIEYYEDTPMLRKPAMLAKEGLVVFSKKILKTGLVNLVPEILKDNFQEEYKVAFGKVLENYTADVFNCYGYKFINENGIKELYKKNKLDGKSVDFLIHEHDGYILIDCKAIEPAPYIKTTSDPERIRQRLKSSFIKGIFQGEHTAFNLLKSGVIGTSKKLSIIVVVHRDHYLSNGLDVESLIYKSLSSEITIKYGVLPIPLSRVYYITIDSLEHLLGVCKKKNISLNAFIDYCSECDSSFKSKRASIDMHMSDIYSEGVEDIQKIKDVKDVLLQETTNIIGGGGKI